MSQKGWCWERPVHRQQDRHSTPHPLQRLTRIGHHNVIAAGMLVQEPDRKVAAAGRM